MNASSNFENLLPCPFCGNNAELQELFDIDTESTQALIACNSCEAKFGPIYPDSQEDVQYLIEDWNTRKNYESKCI
jgi:Lar family restriction alleviation protein